MALNEEQIAEKLAELEPAWAGRPNLFEAQVKAKDADTLLKKLDDSTPAVRADAAEALGRLGAKTAAARLKALLHDADAGVKRSAAPGFL